MTTGYVYVGDPFSTSSVKIGPLTVHGTGDVTLRNDTQPPRTITAGPYIVHPGKYLNQQADGPTGRSYGVLGEAGVAGPWETWRLSGLIVFAWNGESYAFAILP